MKWDKDIRKNNLDELINDKFNRVVAVELFAAGWCNLKCDYCVTGDTRILMSDYSSKAIKDIDIGDEVIGFEEDTIRQRKTFPTKVINKVKRNVDELLHIKTKKHELYITGNHRVLNGKNEWSRSDELSKGESLKTALVFKLNILSKLRNDTITDIKKIEDDFEVYNIETESGTYIANNIAVHNCYIHKQDYLKEIHSEIIRKIKDGSYIKKLKEIFGDRLESISHWGTEPLLTLHEFKDFYNDAVDMFPKFNSIKFSTNIVLNPEIIKNFILNLPLKRKLNIDIQLSLDGPQWITDKNRGPGTTYKIVDNIINLVRILNDVDIYHKVVLNFKPTMARNQISHLKYRKGLYEYYRFFDDVIRSMVKNNKKNNVVIYTTCNPTIVEPEEYTQEDGLNFFALYKEQMKLKQNNDFKYVKPESSYYSRFANKAKAFKEFYTKSNMFTCSAGDSCYSLRNDDRVNICHRLFYLNDSRYQCTERGDVKNTENKYSADVENRDELVKYLYRSRGIHDFSKQTITYLMAMIREYAYCGLISDRYKTDEKLALYLSVFLYSQNCIAESSLQNSSAFIPESQKIKLYGNGAFEAIYDRYLKENLYV